MKFSYFNPNQFEMVAENDDERQYLTMVMETRERCSYQVSAFQFEIDPHHPMQKIVGRVSMRYMTDGSSIKRQEGDGAGSGAVREKEG